MEKNECKTEGLRLISFFFKDIDSGKMGENGKNTNEKGEQKPLKGSFY